MVKIKKKWGLKEEHFLKRSRRGHPRTRERWLALLWLLQGVSQMEVASRLKRSRKTIRDWQSLFEEGGPKALEYSRTGGKETTLSKEEEKQLAHTVATTRPIDVGLVERRWILKVVSVYCQKQFGKELSSEGCRCALKRQGVVLKRPKKKFQKGNPEKQVQFVQEMDEIEKNRSCNAVTVDVDEVHFYLEADLRAMWAYKGKPTTVLTSSPGRKKMNYYGAYIAETGEILLMEAETFNQKNTAEFLKKIREKLPGRRIDLIWDGGKQHRGEKVREALKKYHIREKSLPGYSPELSRIEPLWKWIREDVTYNYCHNKEEELRESILAEVEKIKADKKAMRRRLKRDTSQIKHLLHQNEPSSQKA